VAAVPEGFRCRFNSSYSLLSRRPFWVHLQSFWPIAPAFHAAVGLQTGTVPPVLDVAGGARFGLMNYTAPMGRLRIWTDGLEVTAIASRASIVLSG
jgi:hypothetical protein